MKIVSASVVREMFDYNPETGVLTWRVKRNRMKPGDIAGCLHHQGYIVVTIDGRQYQGHRVAWAHYYGEWPKGGLDHRDTVRRHNWIKNLRRATNVEQNRNRTLSPKNKAGLKGVSTETVSGYVYYRATIYDQGNKINLGNFKTPQEAHAAYCGEAQRRFGEFWRPA